MMKRILVLGFFIVISHIVFGQCTGNVGENIFTDGDFGSGTANILSPDPQLAPGYTYEFNPPPIDGTYSITNNTSSWGGFAVGNWANIGDNSSDPNGYMMVVNASFTPGLFYEQLVNDLCDNTSYVFSVDIYNLAAGIRPNVSFLLDGVIVFESGDIPLNNQWNTYEFTFTTNPGQTTLNLALQNNAPGGDGNDLALDNISFRVCGPEAQVLPGPVVNLCAGGGPEASLEASIIGSQFDNPQIQWQESLDGGITWIDIPTANDFIYIHTDFTEGNYYYRYLLANTQTNLLNNKCRIVSDVEILNIQATNFNFVDTICTGLSYLFGDNTFTTTGTYIDTFTTALGCDSIVTLDLEVVPDSGLSATFIETGPNCHDDENGSILIDTIINGTEPFIIEIDGESSSNGSLSNLVSGDYQYLITDHYGCSFETEITLLNPPVFSVDIGNDLSLELGESIQVIPSYSTSPATFDWVSTFDIDCENCNILDWTPPSSTRLVLNTTNANGCESADSIVIKVFNVRNVFIPNTFSPNDDGYNDFFNIYGAIPNVKIIEEFAVFNRWGAIVYSQKNFLPNETSNGWDGNFQGKRIENGVYIYWAKIRFLDDEILIYKGDVTLIR